MDVNKTTKALEVLAKGKAWSVDSTKIYWQYSGSAPTQSQIDDVLSKVEEPQSWYAGMCDEIANKLDVNLAIVDKRREKANVSEVLNIIGNVKDKDCILIDDIVDTAGTLTNAADALILSGAKSVSAYVTHGVLSGGAVAKVASSPLKSLVTTDSIAATEAFRVAKNVKHISIAPLLGEAVKRIHMERSVSSLFD